MEHAPIYRSTRRLTRAAPIPWRRTASLASAAAGIALGGIALGYHGFAYATDTVQAAASASRNATLPFPAFSVQTVTTTDGGHPDVIGALSSALLAQIQVSPVLIQSLSQPFGPFPSPFPQPQPQPQFQPVVELAPFAEVDLSALVPVEPQAAANDAASMDAPPDQAAADVADVQTGALVAAQIDTRAGLTVSGAEPAVVESAPAADDVADVPEPVAADETQAPQTSTGSAEPVVVIASAPAAPASQTQASVKTAAPPPATLVAEKPEPKPTPVPQVVHRIVVPIDDEPPARAEPAVDRDTPVQVHHPSPPPVVVRPAPPEEDKHPPVPTNKNSGGDSKPGADKAKGGGSKHGG